MKTRPLFDWQEAETRKPTKKGKDKMRTNTKKFGLVLICLMLAALVVGIMMFGAERATAQSGSTAWMNQGIFPTDPVLTPGPSLFIYVSYARDLVFAYTEPFATVSVTVTDGTGGVKATMTGQADEGGEFFSWKWSWDPEPPDIEPGDGVTASAVGLTATVNPIGTIEGALDVDADTLSGTIHAPWFAPLTLTVQCMVLEETHPSVVVTDVAADGGSYVCDFSGQWDILPGQDVAAMYLEPDGDGVLNMFQSPWMRVCYGHDWVGANYPFSHTLRITVTDSAGVVKATAENHSKPGGGWGGGDGFQTEWDDWTPKQPDIEPDDWVYFQSDDGYSNAIHVGTINGTVDVDNDSVSGPIYATWFTQTLEVECHPWGAPDNVPIKNSTAAPDGSSPYFCQWDPLTEWDILPGQDVAAMYIEPDDGDRVINVFRESTPHLHIEKWANGSPAEGSNFVLYIEYWNYGDAFAEDVVITDTMEGMTYIHDTSGFPHTGSGPIIWNLGTLPAKSRGQFDVFVRVTAIESDTVTNIAQIATSNPYDEGEEQEKYSEWSGHVEANDTHLNVGKGAWTGDPAPGYDFVYNVNVCNNGSTSSSEVFLTDTLHPSTILQTWWGQHAGWTEVVSNNNLLVVSRPSLNAWSCEEVRLRVHLDESAWPGMYITNTAVINASSDLEDDDNDAFWDGKVGEPHTNLYINKQLEWGQLVAGGEIAYQINYGNTGNVPVNNVLITDTLPVKTTFSRSWRWTESGEAPITPTVVTADYVVWHIGTLDNGYHGNIGVALEIDSDASPGAVLTNTVGISSQPGEDRYDDNTSTWVETLHDYGPNLRVSKYHWWEGEGRIFYGIWVKNLGPTRMENISITDTYPVSTTSDGNFWVGHGPWFTYTHDAPNRQFIIWAEKLGPGETGHVGFWVDLDESIHGVQGLTFSNAVEAPLPGDVYPDDNSDVELAYTGPDLYAEKWISDGEPRPGARLTLTLRCGNSNISPWQMSDGTTTRLTERLPDGMSYVTSVWPDGTPHPPFFHDPDTGLIVWDMGKLGSEDARWFYLVVDLDTELEGGDVLLNQLECHEWPVVDVDPNPDNNTFELPVTIIVSEYEIYLPLMLRKH